MDSTDDPKVAEDITDDLVTALAHAHNASPAQRRIDHFTSYLEYSISCNLTELKFMIANSKECPMIARKTSLKMFVHILKYVGKLDFIHITDKTAL